MKKWPLKIKLTFLYTVFMTLTICISLGILLSLGNQEFLSSVQEELKERVHESLDEIQIDKEGLIVDKDFYDVEDGIYLSVFNQQGDFLYGRIPYGFNSQVQPKDGQIQTQENENGKWYIFDIKCQLKAWDPLYVCGITSVTKAENTIRIMTGIAVIVLPLLAVLMGSLGYVLSSRTLEPVRKLTETVKDIQKDGDLSRRVGLREGKDELYQLSNTFDRMLEQLEEAFEREKQFTSDVSHELRTPIAVILAQMVSQLLFLSRADQGRQELQKERMNVSELTQMIVDEQKLLADENHITIEAQISEDIYACIDESFYIRMLINLISNAVYYNQKPGWVRISLEEAEDGIKGCVEDKGIGISEEDLPHIWERFYRADTSRNDTSHSGLGLAMVQWIVKAHGGHIQAESKKDEGSRFTFWIPKE